MTSESSDKIIKKKMDVAFMSEDEENCPVVKYRINNVTDGAENGEKIKFKQYEL